MTNIPSLADPSGPPAPTPAPQPQPQQDRPDIVAELTKAVNANAEILNAVVNAINVIIQRINSAGIPALPAATQPAAPAASAPAPAITPVTPAPTPVPAQPVLDEAALRKEMNDAARACVAKLGIEPTTNVVLAASGQKALSKVPADKIEATTAALRAKVS